MTRSPIELFWTAKNDGCNNICDGDDGNFDNNAFKMDKIIQILWLLSKNLPISEIMIWWKRSHKFGMGRPPTTTSIREMPVLFSVAGFPNKESICCLPIDPNQRVRQISRHSHTRLAVSLGWPWIKIRIIICFAMGSSDALGAWSRCSRGSRDPFSFWILSPSGDLAGAALGITYSRSWDLKQQKTWSPT